MYGTIFVKLLTIINVSLIIRVDCYPLTTTRRSIETEPPIIRQIIGVPLRLEDSRIPPSKVEKIKLQNKNPLALAKIKCNKIDRVVEPSNTIIKFAHRVLESANVNSIKNSKEQELLKAGTSTIDWWKNDRRLNNMKRKLLEEIAKRPEFLNRLYEMGWRCSLTEISSKKKKATYDENVKEEKPFRHSENELTSTELYKKVIAGFEEVLEKHTEKGTLTNAKKGQKPIIFVYMPITVLLKPNEINRIKQDTVIEDSKEHSSMKFSPNTFVRSTDPSMLSNIGVVDVPASVGTLRDDEFSSTTELSSEQETESTRLLQLISLVIEEIRKCRLSDKDQSALNRIFGQHLWKLIENEARKKSNEMMNPELAAFIIKGKLAERNSTNKRQNRQRRRPRVATVR